MAKLSILVAICMVVFVAGHGVEHERNKRGTVQVIANTNVLDWLCQNNPLGLYFSWCTATTASPQASTPPPIGTTKPGASSTASSSSTTSSPTVLESAYWCQLSNKTYLTLGQTYLQMPCIMCQCTKTKDIVCNSLQCMPTQCIDGSTPTTKTGQCCSTCAYETQANSCTQNGVTFPHGTVIKNDGTGVQCWCQSGSIECRRSMTSTTTTWSYLSANTSAYLAIVVICLVIMFGALLCCGCGLLYYYYYQQQQQSVQQAYEQYYNNAGWQPMNEDGQVGDAAAKEREATSEQNATEHNYPTGYSTEFVPPPYAVYTGSYGSDAGKGQRHV